MKLTKNDIEKLKKLQPELNIIDNHLSGCFYLSASLKNKSKNRGKKLNIYPWNCDKINDTNYFYDYFYITVILNEHLYPSKTVELKRKVLSWKQDIQSEYWHVNPDDSFCLGSQEDILKMQNKDDFANFINTLLNHYFYYMSYTKLKKMEPWIGHRHGVFAALELACIAPINLELIKPHISYEKNEWNNLLKKTNKIKIENKDDCPFCLMKKSARNCTRHKKQIKGYNNLISYFKREFF